MIDNLKDLITHTHDLGCIDLIKITGTDDETVVEGLAEDRSVIIKAKFHNVIPEFKGVFGMPNMSNLKTILGLEVYAEDASVTVQQDDVKGPTGIRFVNSTGDFKNTYRFMVKDHVEEQLKSVKAKGFASLDWDIDIEPTAQSIQRLKFQSQCHPTELTFVAKTEDSDLKFYFGDHSTHAGDFVFAHDVTGELKRGWHWPINHVNNILSLAGDKVYRISDGGATEIIVDSGLAEYTYILPAMSK